MDWKTLKIPPYGFKLIQEAGIFFINWQNLEISCVSYTLCVQYIDHTTPPPRHTFRVHTRAFSSLRSPSIYFFLPFSAFSLSTAVFAVSMFVAHYGIFVSLLPHSARITATKICVNIRIFKLCTLLSKTWNYHKAERWCCGQYSKTNVIHFIFNLLRIKDLSSGDTGSTPILVRSIDITRTQYTKFLCATPPERKQVVIETCRDP
jgi:hypothetical protein